MRFLALLTAALALAAPAHAGDLAVFLATAKGQGIADAVVMVLPAAGASRPRPAGSYRMAQKDLTFDPFVLVVPVGAEVAFPNLDKVRHHVYSFSPAKTFELKLYGRDETRYVRFERPGVVGIGCNIHDNMSAFIRVVDTPWAARTTRDGAILRDVPAGRARVVVWHPYLKGPRSEVVRDVVVPDTGLLRVALAGEMRSPRLPRGGY
jgi:plastocyanin